MPMQRCKDLRACLVTVNIGGSTKTEDKAEERRSMQCGFTARNVCYSPAKALGMLGNAEEAAHNSRLFALFLL